MIQDTSLEAYYGHVLPRIGEKRTMVLKAIVQLQPCTDLEIAQHLGLQINQVTGRRNELAYEFELIHNHGRKTQNGRPAMTWVTNNYDQKQGELFNNYGR